MSEGSRFTGRVALVTGGTSGIGLATVEALTQEGASVATIGLDAAQSRSTAARLAEMGADVLVESGDLALSTVRESLVRATLDRYGTVDYLVNNAFSFIARGADATELDWRDSLAVGPMAYAHLVAMVAETMPDDGAIVNVSSVSAHVAQRDHWTYNASKGAVAALTRCMALDLAPRGIRVNSVSPGWVWTPEVEKAAQLDGGGRDKWEPIWGRFHMLGRVGHPDEIASAILFLLSTQASFITGTDLVVDGGYLSMGPERMGSDSVYSGGDR